MSSATNPKRKCYDVYLGFCDEDAGSFALELYTALTSEAGITVFRDGERIGRGDQEISTSVLNVIEDCKVVVVILSKNYMYSRWYLQELEKITECYRTENGPIVLPVFYSPEEMSPEDMYEEAFHGFLDRISMKEKTSSEDEDKFMSWVAEISNEACKYHSLAQLRYEPNENRVILITKVVECATLMISKKRASFHIESIHSRAQDVIQLLKQSKSPLLIGIWGMTGIGKTTIAKAIYEQIGNFFEYRCFLNDISRVWKRNGGQVYVQEQLLSSIDRPTELNYEKWRGPQLETIPTTEAGRVILKETLRHKTVLLLLDHVDKLEQLKDLCGNQDWFGPGSKIIIMTTDRHLLKEHGVHHIYSVKELNESESLALLNWGGNSLPTNTQRDFGELSRQLVTNSGRLPLALKELGLFLNGKEALQWKNVLKSLERLSIPAPRLQEALEKSFSYLSDEEKRIFLDIACFFVGMNQKDVLQTTQYTTLQISLLEDKSLVTIDKNNKLQMHVMLQAMARGIIKRESSQKTDQPKMYDVFLSFRGDDSRAKFVSHLHSSLQNSAIHVFKDDDEIERGDQISISLLRAIGRSRIAIVVLSKKYANSRWCMLELEKIMEIGRVRGLVVVPVFYKIDPSQVRHQKGQFGKGFDDLISKISVDESTKSIWRRDLIVIGGIAGFVLKHSRNESDDIKNVVEHVTRLLDRKELFVAEHPVGIESRVQAATKLLNIQNAEDVLLLGIWGMGGIGKTTIAKAIYNEIGSKFDGKSFLLNIREFWETGTDQVSLQQRVLCDVYKTTSFKIRDIESGKNILKQRLAQKRVFFVLDDVNELDQLKALCGSREWFGSGSRIIITTRDMHLLRSCRVDRVYKIEEMDESEALALFSWHAFKQPSPIEDFATHSTDVIAYSGRLPLALEVLGSYLSDCEITEWQKVLEKLRCIPHDQVQKKLRISFDGLKDTTEKHIFLDIACFFIGMNRNDVIQILNGCGFFADVGVKVLVERSLVTVDNRNKLRMHDLLRDMGRQIIYEESPLDPENRSRLWRCEEALDILSMQKGTEAIKGLALKFQGEKTVCLNTEAFTKMNKLRLLQLAGVQLNGDFKCLSKDLRWLYWHGFPLTYVPAEFQQGNLVAIKLKHSNLKQIWKKSQMVQSLTILDLSHSLCLTETPNFSYLPNLEKLVLKDCPSLSAVSHSIGSLQKLLLINLTDCTGLQKLPRSIYTLKSLETLILSGCSKINKLEEDIEQMESLTTLIADKTAITKVPSSIVRLKSIGYISLSGFEGFSNDVFPSIIRSWMSPSNNVESLVQTSVFKDLPKLRSLWVECNSKRQLSRNVKNILDVLKATNCRKLDESETISQNSDMFPSLLIDDSLGQVCTSGSKNYLKSFLIQMGTKFQVSNIAEDSVLQTTDGTCDSFLLPCDNISDWLTFSCKGCSIIFVVPTVNGSYLKSMMLFIVYKYSSPDNITSEGCQGLFVINYTKTTIQAYKRDTLTSFEDEDWQSIKSNLEPGNEVEVIIVFEEGFTVEKTTIYLLYDESTNKEMEHCNAVEEEDAIVSGNEDTDVSVSGGYNLDVPLGNNITGLGQDENISEDKNLHAMNKSSGDDAMETNKKCACCFWWR